MWGACTISIHCAMCNVGNLISRLKFRFSGSLVKLSAQGALVKSDSQETNSIPSVLTNIKNNLFPSNNLGAIAEDIYAKVLDKPVESGYFYILFTSKPPEVKALLDSQYSKLIN